MANAAEDNKVDYPTESLPNDNTTAPEEENQLVYALDDNVTATSDDDEALADDQVVHDGQGDEPARNGAVNDDAEVPETVDEDDTFYTTQDSSLTEESNSLGAAQTGPDYTVALLGTVALAAVAACAAVVVVRRRKATAS